MPDSIECSEEGCLIAATGICKRTGESKPCDAASGVSDLTFEDQVSELSSTTELAGDRAEKVEVATETDHRLPSGMELAIGEVSGLMDERYGHLIAILGVDDAGKTSFLCSLYCMAACGDLEPHGFRFAGSQTLPGFEARTRKSRNWEKGKVPDRMTYRTQYEAGRGAGFLHLDLQEIAPRRHMRLLLSDLPGEWTTNLIDNARHSERFAFIDRSDAILILIEGPSLVNPETRLPTINRHKILIDRLAALTQHRCALGILATKGDQIGMVNPDALHEISHYAETHGFSVHISTVSSFSGSPEIRSGSNIFESLTHVLRNSNPVPQRREAEAVGTMPHRFFGWDCLTCGGAR